MDFSKPNRFRVQEDKLKKIYLEQNEICAYCRKTVNGHDIIEGRRDWWTIEHLDNTDNRDLLYWKDGVTGVKEEDLAICCWSCNSSRGKKILSVWFQRKNIDERKVAERVKKYIEKTRIG